ncbi:MAG TPA: hypothetical protein VLQ45_26035, partial [Thermoanaerobaculia bacterium]|nr:hypothetical protein [Thermoanaerobaculia bacterium]
MTEWHVPEELLERFLRVESSREESRRVVQHLLSGCPECSERAYRLAGECGLFSRRTGGEPRYDEVFARALAFASEQEQRLAVEKLRGWAQWAELEPMNPQLRLVAVQSDPRFHNFGLYTRLLEASRWYSRTEPAEAVDIVRLAVLVAERLDRETIGDGRAADLEAAAWAALGNAQRMADDFEGARRSLNEAWRILEQRGTHDPMDRASLISLEASYLKDIGEFEMAESILEKALDLYRKAGDSHQQGRILFQMGDVIGSVD